MYTTTPGDHESRANAESQQQRVMREITHLFGHSHVLGSTGGRRSISLGDRVAAVDATSAPGQRRDQYQGAPQDDK